MSAKFESAYTSLKINKTVEGGTEPGQKFVFHVVGDATRGDAFDVDMYVTIGENGGTITLNELPVGVYTITEMDWAWRYDVDNATKKATLTKPTIIPEVSFTNTKVNDKWLSHEVSVDNIFGSAATTGSGN